VIEHRYHKENLRVIQRQGVGGRLLRDVRPVLHDPMVSEGGFRVVFERSVSQFCQRRERVGSLSRNTYEYWNLFDLG
jgi:hypothetical protein